MVTDVYKRQEYTGEELDSDTWQAELHIEVFLPAQVPDSELDSWMESRICLLYTSRCV